MPCRRRWTIVSEKIRVNSDHGEGRKGEVREYNEELAEATHAHQVVGDSLQGARYSFLEMVSALRASDIRKEVCFGFAKSKRTFQPNKKRVRVDGDAIQLLGSQRYLL